MASSEKQTKKTSRPIWSYFFSVVPSCIFILGLVPLIPLVYVVITFSHLFTFSSLWLVVALPFLIYISLVFILLSELCITGGIIRLCRITYQPGSYEYSYRDWNFVKWTLICVLYTPFRKILEIVPLGRIKQLYFKLLGMKIGKNTLVGGVIKDPCLTEFGDNVTMGEYAIIYGHIHNMQQKTIFLDKIKIGNNCVIGAGAIIMPGVILEDDVTIAAGALVPKGQVLQKGKIYGGVPAKEINKKKG